MHLIITRPDADAVPLAALLKARGHTPHLLPLLEIVFNDPAPPDYPAPPVQKVNKENIMPENIGALAFTSANGVRAFGHYAKNNPHLFSLPIFAIGAHTSQVAQEALAAQAATPPAAAPVIFEAAGDVAALATMIVQNRAAFKGSVWHVVGRHQAGDLVGALHAHAIAATTAVLYEARPIKSFAAALAAHLKEQPEGGVLLYSPRTAALFCDAWARQSTLASAPASSSFTAFCLSAAVAEVVQQKLSLMSPKIKCRIAAQPTQDALLDLLT